MHRRRVLKYLAGASIPATAGCLGSSSSQTELDSSTIFENYQYEDEELLVRFQEDIDVEKVMLGGRQKDEQYESVEPVTNPVHIPVVFPEKLETHLRPKPPLKVRAETPNGQATLPVWEPIHGALETLTIQPDGSASMKVKNLGGAPLLVKFIGIHGNVPTPTRDPRDDSQGSRGFNPNIVGVNQDSPLSPDRTDLIVPPEQTVQYETIHTPFAFSSNTDVNFCNGDERIGTITIIQGSGESWSYDFNYTLDGETVDINGQSSISESQTPIEVCSRGETSYTNPD